MNRSLFDSAKQWISNSTGVVALAGGILWMFGLIRKEVAILVLCFVAIGLIIQIHTMWRLLDK